MKRIILAIVLTSFVLLIVGCTVNLDTSTTKETRVLTLLEEGISVLEVDVSSGGLIIIGEEGREGIEAVANIEYTKNIKKEDVQFSLEQNSSNDSAKLIGDFKSSVNVGYNSQSMDIVVKIPKAINLIVKDGSGDMQISNIDGKLEIDDGSGDIEIINVKNITSIEDGSGDLLIKNSGGNNSIDDGSGNIEILQYTGVIKLIDGSGNIDVENLDGTITVDDGSGDITINDVTKDVIIKEDGSGDVDIDNVKGRISKQTQ